MSMFLEDVLHTYEKNPIEIILVGLGFMGFGFLSAHRNNSALKVGLIISRRPGESVTFLEHHGYSAEVVDSVADIHKNVKRNWYSVSDNLDLIAEYDTQVVFEVTGTVDYATEIALKTLDAGKHLVTMNPELQATVGTELKRLFNQKKLLISDVIGDQPGSLARLMSTARLQGFRPVLAGNMKRYLDIHATQAKMQPWADDKGLAVRQTVSFTDGTKQSIEMTLVSNYFDMTILEAGMKGPRVDRFDQVLNSFDWNSIPSQGVVDYMIGLNLFPGVFVVAEHSDPHQQKYLRYLNMGNGPRYVLFDSYHLCHLEVIETIIGMVHFSKETINNSLTPQTGTISVAKFDLQKGIVLDGIGGDTVYGSIRKIATMREYLPVGVSQGAVLKHDVPQDVPIRLSDVELKKTAATELLGLI